VAEDLGAVRVSVGGREVPGPCRAALLGLDLVVTCPEWTARIGPARPAEAPEPAGEAAQELPAGTITAERVAGLAEKAAG
jgi:hypothetical protein